MLFTLIGRANKYLKHYYTFLPYLLGFKKVENIPVIINNRNRLTYLRELINWLEKAGLTKIYIIDNASTYPPLLDFYDKIEYTVFRLDQNIGYLALWQTELFLKFKNGFYIYTDPDVVPVENCPLEVNKYFFNLLKRNVDIEKVGFGLKIDDLPDHYKLKADVIEHELKFWTKEREVYPGVFHASIDTTFAMYKPGVEGGYWANAFRTGPPYVARHLPWYIDSHNLSEEEIFYRASVGQGATHWSGK